MTNGNDYLEVEESHYQQIEEDYILAIKEGKEEIPDKFKFDWVSSFMEGE